MSATRKAPSIKRAAAQAIAKRRTTALRSRPELSPAAQMFESLAIAVADPRMDVEKMKALLDQQERLLKWQAEEAFNLAMAKLQPKLPQIDKNGAIVVKGQIRSRYALLSDIDSAIRPLLARAGFAFSFNSESSDGKHFKITCTLSHEAGHKKEYCLLLPLDASDFRSGVQSVGSTLSYGRRQLVKMALNIIEKGEDTDGTSLAYISPEQVKDLDALINEVNADKKRFLAYLGVNSLEEIAERDYKTAVANLERKRVKAE